VEIVVLFQLIRTRSEKNANYSCVHTVCFSLLIAILVYKPTVYCTFLMAFSTNLMYESAHSIFPKLQQNTSGFTHTHTHITFSFIYKPPV